MKKILYRIIFLAVILTISISTNSKIYAQNNTDKTNKTINNYMNETNKNTSNSINNNTSEKNKNTNNNINESSEDTNNNTNKSSEDTNKYVNETIDNYLDTQLEQIDISQIQEYMNQDNSVLKKMDIKTFTSDLLKGKKNIFDLFDKDNIRLLLFKEVKSALKMVSIVLVLAMLSSVLKSLENSFSSGAVANVANYVIFISLVVFTLAGFKDIIEICFSSVDRGIGLMQIIVPILMALLVVMGLPITSSTLSPIFLVGNTVINIVFKNILFTSLIIAFSVLVVNNLSENIKLKKAYSFLKNFNLVATGAVFSIFLALISIQTMYVTNFDKFTVKSAKFAIGNLIPVVGGFVSDSMDMLLSSSQLIKNVFGGIGLIVLIGICAIPLIKIISVIFVYKAVAIIVEPIGEENISNMLNEVANLMSVAFAEVVSITVMFFITVSIITSIGVVGK
ncbi:MAG: stage III sporulation protein AE [Clostridioides sp.]|jgi:stage III sporulation protein AE|nr:stage III sporulation protein AE [Clostridioides sp.]